MSHERLFIAVELKLHEVFCRESGAQITPGVGVSVERDHLVKTVIFPRFWPFCPMNWRFDLSPGQNFHHLSEIQDQAILL